MYPCAFNTSFMPETARATVGVGCARRNHANGGPELGLQACGIRVDLPKVEFVGGSIEQHPLIEISP